MSIKDARARCSYFIKLTELTLGSGCLGLSFWTVAFETTLT